MHTVTTLDAEAVAQQKLRCSKKTFQNNRKALARAGFPEKLDIPGQPLWLESDVDAWLQTRRQAPTINERRFANAKAPVEVESAPVAPSAPVKRGRIPNHIKFGGVA